RLRGPARPERPPPVRPGEGPGCPLPRGPAAARLRRGIPARLGPDGARRPPRRRPRAAQAGRLGGAAAGQHADPGTRTGLLPPRLPRLAGDAHGPRAAVGERDGPERADAGPERALRRLAGADQPAAAGAAQRLVALLRRAS